MVNSVTIFAFNKAGCNQPGAMLSWVLLKKQHQYCLFQPTSLDSTGWMPVSPSFELSDAFSLHFILQVITLQSWSQECPVGPHWIPPPSWPQPTYDCTLQPCNHYRTVALFLARSGHFSAVSNFLSSGAKT